MKLTFKTVKGAQFTLDVDLSSTIGALKQQLEKEQGEEFAASVVKLIHAGKILSDDTQLIGMFCSEICDLLLFYPVRFLMSLLRSP